MKLKLCASSSALVLLGCMGSTADEAADLTPPIEIEELTVESEITPGPNMYVVSSNWGGASAVTVLSADDLSYKGNIATGMTPQFFLAADNSIGYVASAFAERITYGDISAFFQEVDIKTLAFGQEVKVPEKLAQTMAQMPAMSVTENGKWAFVQNATPATSISVIDLEKGEVVSEIPNPGCWGIYPSSTPTKYSTLCGDGALVTYTFDEDGKETSQTKSSTVFDIETKPLFVHSERAGDTLYFVTYDGTLITLSDKSKKISKVDEWTFTEGIEGDWAPGGYEVMALNAPNNIMFVLMHSGATDGSHKDSSEEIWALDLKAKKVLYRSASEHMSHVDVTQDKDTPILFGSNSHEGGLYRYEIDPEAKYAAKLTASIKLDGVSYVVAEK